jgi:hypothetical protein
VGLGPACASADGFGVISPLGALIHFGTLRSQLDPRSNPRRLGFTPQKHIVHAFLYVCFEIPCLSHAVLTTYSILHSCSLSLVSTENKRNCLTILFDSVVTLVMTILIYFVDAILANAICASVIGLALGPIFPATLFLANELMPKEVHMVSMAFM